LTLAISQPITPEPVANQHAGLSDKQECHHLPDEGLGLSEALFEIVSLL